MYLDASALSDGTLRFIALATLLLQTRLPETIIIDEPELGLHPAAMVKLSAMIKKASAKSQIIIATQSVTLISNFSISDLIVVGREESQSTFDRLKEEDFLKYFDNEPARQLQSIVDSYDNPEDINSSPEGAPSKRLLKIVPEYDKVIFGNIVAMEIGITSILEKCPRFRAWVESLIQRCRES